MKIKKWFWTANAILLILTFGLAMVFGATSWGWKELKEGATAAVFDPGSTESLLFSFRLLRVGVSFLAGTALAMSGSVLQRLLKNPLADPFILGISSGGTLTAALGALLGLPAFFLGVPVRVCLALLGCFTALGLILVARRRLVGLADEYAIPVLGLILNSFFGAALMVIILLIEQTRVGEVYRWLLGSVQTLEAPEFLVCGLAVLGASGLLLRWAAPMQTLAFGDDFARTVGVDAVRLRRMALLLVAILVAVAVSIAGSVGFVGLIVPHIARKVIKRHVRGEWICSALWGGSLVILGDTLGRSLAAPTELPVGLFTSLLGTPALAVILFGRVRKAAS